MKFQTNKTSKCPEASPALGPLHPKHHSCEESRILGSFQNQGPRLYPEKLYAIKYRVPTQTSQFAEQNKSYKTLLGGPGGLSESIGLVLTSMIPTPSNSQRYPTFCVLLSLHAWYTCCSMHCHSSSGARATNPPNQCLAGAYPTLFLLFTCLHIL